MVKCAENRSNLELGDDVRAKRHRRRSGYNTKVERLGAKLQSIGGGIVKYKHKTKQRRPRFGSLNETRLAETVVVERKPKEPKKDRGRNTLTRPRYEAVLVR